MSILSNWFKTPRFDSQKPDELQADRQLLRIKYGLYGSLALLMALAMPALAALSPLFPITWAILAGLIFPTVFLTLAAALNGAQLRSVNRIIDRPSAAELRRQLATEKSKEGVYIFGGISLITVAAAVCGTLAFFHIISSAALPLLAMGGIVWLVGGAVAGKRSGQIEFELKKPGITLSSAIGVAARILPQPGILRHATVAPETATQQATATAETGSIQMQA